MGAPEHPGAYCFPPIAAAITGAARLMLAVLERSVTDAGGSYALCDTDSMAIVSTPEGGLIPCPGGPDTTSDGQLAVRALSFDQVDEICERLAALNPYDRAAVPGSILEIEHENHNDRGERRQLYCYSISAKRYALYELDSAGNPQLVKWSQHGLGHLMNPTGDHDRDWIRELWQHELDRVYDVPSEEPDWLDRTALGRITVTKPTVLRAFRNYNEPVAYPDAIKPFNFMLTAQVASFAHPAGVDPTHFQLIAPWTPNPDDWPKLEWINRDHPDERYTAHPRDPDGPRLKTYRDVNADYRTHPEPKSLAPDGARCGWHTRGLLQRRPVTATRIVYIGKESNAIEDAAANLTHHPDQLVTEISGGTDEWTDFVLPVLRSIPRDTLLAETGLDRTMLWRYLKEASRPHPDRCEALAELAHHHAKAALTAAGHTAPSDRTDCLAAWLSLRTAST
jgi:hypothetical protein